MLTDLLPPYPPVYIVCSPPAWGGGRDFDFWLSWVGLKFGDKATRYTPCTNKVITCSLCNILQCHEEEDRSGVEISTKERQLLKKSKFWHFTAFDWIRKLFKLVDKVISPFLYFIFIVYIQTDTNATMWRLFVNLCNRYLFTFLKGPFKRDVTHLKGMRSGKQWKIK